MSERVRALPRRMDEHGTRLKLPGCTTAAMTHEELVELRAVVDWLLREEPPRVDVCEEGPSWHGNCRRMMDQ